MNMTFNFELPHPTSTAFLFRTISTLPSQASLLLTTQPPKPVAKNHQSPKSPPRTPQKTPQKATQKSKFSTFVKEFSKSKRSKKTRNISRGQIQNVNHRKGKESVTLFEEIKISDIPLTEMKKVKKPIPGKKTGFVKKLSPVKNYQIIPKQSPIAPKSKIDLLQKMNKSPVKKNIPAVSIKKRKFSTSPVGRLSLSKP